MNGEGKSSETGRPRPPRLPRPSPPPEYVPPPTLEELLRAAPGLARIAAGVGWQGAVAAAEAYLKGATRVVRAASAGESTAQVLQETRSEVRSFLRDALGLSEAGPRRARDSSTEALRRRGAELLHESTELEDRADLHPAYMRILEALAPDEGRVLRFLARNGTQPAVDVRSGLPLASHLVSQGLTMIGEEAGCLHGDRIHPYLDNLHRLGLIWFSREPVSDPRRYQVLEAQPDVVAALAEGGRLARTVRRSILLTPFGEDFCITCLPLGEPAADPDPSAGHAAQSDAPAGGRAA
jgi:hypothetical protein